MTYNPSSESYCIRILSVNNLIKIKHSLYLKSNHFIHRIIFQFTVYVDDVYKSLGNIPLFCGIISPAHLFLWLSNGFSYESTNDNEMPQTLIEDIEPAFEMIRPIPIIFRLVWEYFSSEFFDTSAIEAFRKIIHHETLLHMNGEEAIQTKALVQNHLFKQNLR